MAKLKPSTGRHLLFLLVALVAAPACADVQVKLSPYALLQSSSSKTAWVPLSKLASVSAPKALREKLTKMPIEVGVSSLSSGHLLQNDIEKQVQAWLKQEAPQEKLVVSGSASVLLKKYQQKVAANLVVESAENALSKALTPHYDTFSVKRSSRHDDVLLLTQDAWSLRTNAQTTVHKEAVNEKAIPVKARMCITVDVMQKGNVIKTVPVWFAVKAVRPVWVVQQSVESGQVVNEVSLQKMPMDVASLDSPAVKFTEEWQGKIFAVPAVSGQVLTKAMLQEEPWVKPGDTVQVSVVQGKVRIHAAAEALQAGLKGQQVKLRSLSSHEEFLGTVVARGEIQVGGHASLKGEGQ